MASRSRFVIDWMYQARKGQQWHFGVKLRIGVDSQTGLVHGMRLMATNEDDKHSIPGLLYGEECRFYGDAACQSQEVILTLFHGRSDKRFNTAIRGEQDVEDESRAQSRAQSI
jgi:transposase, IS5 family